MKTNLVGLIPVSYTHLDVYKRQARGDMATVEKHIEVLDERKRELYKELTNVIFDMKNGGIE